MSSRRVLLALLVPVTIRAQARSTSTATVDTTRYERTAPELRGLRWRLVGPFRGGRAVAVTGDPRNPRVFYFGAVDGGVWKSTNAGQSWANITDGKSNISSVGAIAVAGSDPNVVYVGGGESDFARTIRTAMASIAPPMAAAPGRTSDSTTRATSRASLSIRETRRSCTSRQWGTAPVHELDARSLPIARRRAQLAEGALRRRFHRCDRPNDGPGQPAHSVRGALAHAAPPLGFHRWCRSERPLEIHGRRRPLDGADVQRRDAARPARAHRRRGVARRPRATLCDYRNAARGLERRDFSLRRWRAHLAAHEWRSALDGTTLVLLRRPRRSDRREHDVRDESFDVEVDRRRTHLHAFPPAARRHARSLDRSQRFEETHQRQRRRCGRSASTVVTVGRAS